ncbi:CPBP family intramembrane metalloprotease [Nocardioides sp. cx-169]|uniref:CPBP family intramembrane glutamic endopeptidase n=1 Tax=Nocardioides sp. cx-169 TaxID=2899080 RepID=UPI001E450DFA|nr:type II CAAX endopeptidase family protein [Nocardioides sp. cx-169]MCD4535965.1 CPBP family intramembrane metalloprotease [Nocardioides sp. cx-169]
MEPLGYHRLQRAVRWAWWRPLVGVVAVVALVFALQLVVSLAVTVLLVVRGTSPDDALDQLSGIGEVTPAYLAVINLGWAVAIPAVWLVAWAVHRLRPGWLASVGGRIRWTWLVACFGLAMLALMATVIVGAFVPAQDVETSGNLNEFTRQTRDFLLVIVLLTPLQAAGEEYAFRGYLTQAVGGVFRSPRLAMVAAVVVPALLFALAHGAQDPPIFVDRLAFGLVAGALVILTGGLEAGIAMHVLNNFLAFGAALAFGDMTSALNPTGGTWWSLPVTLTQSLVYLGLAVWVSRLMGVRRTWEQPVLEPIRPRV